MLTAQDSTQWCDLICFDPPSSHPHVFRSPQFLSNLSLIRVSTSMEFLPAISWAFGLLVFFHHLHVFLHHALEVILPLVFFISSFGALALPLVFVIQFVATYFTRRPKVVSTSSQTVCGDSIQPRVVFASRQGQCYHLNSSCTYNGSNVDIVQLRRCRTCG